MELTKSSINPEDLMYPTYREHIVKYLVGLASFGKPVVIFAPKGNGLTRLLRFVTYGSYPTKPKNVRFVYVNILDFVDKPDQAIIDTFEEFYKAKTTEVVCFVLDELVPDLDNLGKIIRLLRSFRGKYDNIGVSFITGITYKESDEFNPHNPPEFLTDFFGHNRLILPPLTQIDFFKTASTMGAQMGLTLNRSELEDIYKKTNGVPADLKRILQDKFKEKYLGKEMATEVKGVDLRVDSEKILCSNVRIDLDLTRSEEVVLRHFILNRGKVIHRDIISEILSPESGGEGVSNESIDQVIYRLRKKLDKIGCFERIETYVGKGYGLVNG